MKFLCWFLAMIPYLLAATKKNNEEKLLRSVEENKNEQQKNGSAKISQNDSNESKGKVSSDTDAVNKSANLKTRSQSQSSLDSLNSSIEDYSDTEEYFASKDRKRRPSPPQTQEEIERECAKEREKIFRQAEPCVLF